MDVPIAHVLDVPQKLYISVVSSHMEVDKGRDSSLFPEQNVFMKKHLLSFCQDPHAELEGDTMALSSSSLKKEG